jgi:dihydrofolate reductase
MAEGRDVFISGGYGLFKEAIPIVERMYLTEVDLEVPDGDTFFPEFDEDDFDKEVIGTGGDEIKYTRMLYTRKKS